MAGILIGNSSSNEAVGSLGFKGETGDSAYEISVKHGYTGTEAQWADDFLNAENYYDKGEADTLLSAKANVDVIPIGSIISYGGINAPTNWLVCDGSAVSRTTYADLFTTIGTTYGSGDGSTTFNLPNLKGRVPVGQDTSDTAFDTLGETGGEKTHTLTIQEMPSHNHSLGIGTPTTGGTTYTTSSGTHYMKDDVFVWDGDGGTFHVPNLTTWSGTNSVSTIGGGQAHNNLQPYQVVRYIIKAV